MSSVGVPPRPGSRRALAELQAEWENRELMHAVLKHQFGNGAAIRVGAVFEKHVLTEVAAEVARRIVNIPKGRQFIEHRRARFMVDAVKQIVRKGSDKAKAALLREAAELADIETRFLAKLGKDVLGAQFRTPAPSLVEAAITRTPMMGRPFGEWFTDFVPRQTETRVIARVQAGMVAGESTPQILRALQGTKAAGYTNGELARSRTALKAMTQTTMTHTAVGARDLTFRKNADVVPRVRWVSTLDLRTTPMCLARDGMTWKVDEVHPMPPAHIGCRSTLVPAIGPPIGMRAALGGRVDGKTTAEQWLRGRSVADQNLALGKAKAEAWRGGKLELDEMVDSLFSRVISNRELRAAGLLPTSRE